jgi:lysophospholipase L1-like esterase
MHVENAQPIGLDKLPSRPPLSRKRRLLFATAIYLAFLLILVIIEVGTRLILPRVNSLDLFVNTPQQKMQVATQQQATIFEGDPLLLWRLRPNLNHAVWDFTVLSTNAQHYRSDYPIGSKAKGTTRIVCVGDSVTFGYRVPVVWPDRPDDYDRAWLPFPMLLEKELRAANPGRSIEVIAMAAPGYTSHQGLTWLRSDIDTLEPNLLVVSFGWNDASFSDVADREAIRTNWYAVAVRWLIDHSQAFAHATRWLRSGQQPASAPARRPVPRVSDQEYVNNIREIVGLGRSRQIGVVVLAAPYRDSVTNPAEAKVMIHYREQLRAAMVNDQIPFLELPELTEKGYPANEGLFGELIHPNHMGHRLIASELLKLFTRNRLLNDLNNATLTP